MDLRSAVYTLRVAAEMLLLMAAMHLIAEVLIIVGMFHVLAEILGATKGE